MSRKFDDKRSVNDLRYSIVLSLLIVIFIFVSSNINIRKHDGGVYKNKKRIVIMGVQWIPKHLLLAWVVRVLNCTFGTRINYTTHRIITSADNY